MKKWIICVLAVLLILLGSCQNREDVSKSLGAEQQGSSGVKPPAGQSSHSALYPQEWEDHGIFSASYEKAYLLLQSMTLEEKAGQIFQVRCPQEGEEIEQISAYYPGGYVLFGKDFQGKTKEQVSATIQSYQKASKIPMLMATDEEGGEIVRISSNPNLAEQRFLSPQQAYQNGGLNGIRADALSKAALLKKLGVNVNLAPVCDVSTNPGDYIYNRTLGQGAEETAEFVAAVVASMNEEGISSTLKHFPGYGNNADTHTGIANDQREYSQFEQVDFVPFQRGIQAGAQCVLVSHNIVRCMDKQYPASLSPKVHDVLRQELGFTGVIVTDDLAMGAIRDYTGGNNPAVQALLAGNDMLMVDDPAEYVKAILNGIADGTISQKTLDRAVFRVLAWKYQMGLIQ